MAINNWRTYSSWDDALTALQNIMNTWFASGDDALNAVKNIVDTWYASWNDALDDVSRIVLGDSKNNGYVWYTPNTSTTSYFSLPEALKIQSQGYKEMWDTNLANAYNSLWTWSNQYSNVAKQIGDFYWQLSNDVINRENMLGQEKANLSNTLIQDLLNSKDYVMSMFGPNGTLTNEVNKYYTDMWNYLATEAGREAANIAAQWVHSWASLWAIRAQQNEAYNNAYSRYLQAKEQEINAKQQIASNLINYMSTLRKEYWDTTNQYIISQYERANDLLNSISTDLVNQYTQLAWAQIKTWGSGSGSSSSQSTNPFLDLMKMMRPDLFADTTKEESDDATKSNGNFVATETDKNKKNNWAAWNANWTASNQTITKPAWASKLDAAAYLAKKYGKYTIPYIWPVLAGLDLEDYAFDKVSSLLKK